MSRLRSDEALSVGREREGWYCLRTQVKREQVAALSIQKIINLNVFAPSISFLRKTKNGPKRFTEALFPGYIFVDCDFFEHRRHLMAMNGVAGAVHFADHYPRLPDAVIKAIQEQLGGEHRENAPRALQPGDAVEIVEGPFASMAAQVCCIEKGSDRVALLIEFLGQDLKVDLPRASIYDPREQDCRSQIIPVKQQLSNGDL